MLTVCTKTSCDVRATQGHGCQSGSAMWTDSQVLPSKTVSLALVLISPTLLVAVHS